MDDYELSGELTEGESTITVTYQGKTATFKVTVHAAHTHNWSDSSWHETTAPTCTTAGEERRDCTADPDDPHHETRAVDALGHDAGEWHITEPATCIATGTKELRCTVDGFVLDTGTIDIDLVNGHDWNTDFTITPATESTNGIKAILCKLDEEHTKDEEFSGEYATGTAGLSFEAIPNANDPTSYRVSRDTATGDIVIPAHYRPNADTSYLPVTEIGNGTNTAANPAFGGTSAEPNTTVTSITFAEGSQLATISNYAFAYSSNLASITIPDSVTTVGLQAFGGWTSAQTINVPWTSGNRPSGWDTNWNFGNATIVYQQ